MEEHLKDRRDAVGERDAVAGEEGDEILGFIPAGVDLTDAEKGCDVGHAPGVHVKHRREGHVDVVGTEGEGIVEGGETQTGREGMEHELAVAEEDALGFASGSRRVEKGGGGVFAEFGELKAGRGLGEEGLVVANERDDRCRDGFVIREGDVGPDGFQVREKTLDEREEVRMDEEDGIAGVLNGEEGLVRGEADVDGMKHGAEHWHGKEAFEVTVAVPIDHTDAVARADAEFDEHAGEAFNPFKELRVSELVDVAVDNFL